MVVAVIIFLSWSTVSIRIKHCRRWIKAYLAWNRSCMNKFWKAKSLYFSPFLVGWLGRLMILTAFATNLCYRNVRLAVQRHQPRLGNSLSPWLPETAKPLTRIDSSKRNRCNPIHFKQTLEYILLAQLNAGLLTCWKVVTKLHFSYSYVLIINLL